jgi:oxygen-independent coproporphyrinogen-3 oxidase
MKSKFSIYIHWPYCLSKCPYCDFNSHVSKEKIDQDQYSSLIKKELDHYSEVMNSKNISSIFFGGGTPSLMDPSVVYEILNHIEKKFNFDDKTEITLEANPTSVELDKFRHYSDFGINRVSIGVQSLNDIDLKKLGRNHTSKEAIRAIEIAHQYFNSISIDLIYSRPGQKINEWKAELLQALALGTHHISLYQLTIEPKTTYEKLFKSGKLILPNEELSRELYLLTESVCKDYSLFKYELSNFSKKGHESIHNLNYWNSGEWVGVGPGAHSRIENKDGERISIINEYDPRKWQEYVKMSGFSSIKKQNLSQENICDEYILMSMRTSKGMSVNKYIDLGGHLDKTKLKSLTADGYIKVNKNTNYLQITSKGSIISDYIISELAL